VLKKQISVDIKIWFVLFYWWRWAHLTGQGKKNATSGIQKMREKWKASQGYASSFLLRSVREQHHGKILIRSSPAQAQRYPSLPVRVREMWLYFYFFSYTVTLAGCAPPASYPLASWKDTRWCTPGLASSSAASANAPMSTTADVSATSGPTQMTDLLFVPSAARVSPTRTFSRTTCSSTRASASLGK